MKSISTPTFLLAILMLVSSAIAAGAQRPNFILIMCDDLGYGDTGFNGNTIIKTPHLDALARRGVVLTHFYSGNSVCSPTRGSCLTGRHHDRYGIFTANNGHLPKQEITLASMLKQKGYTTGHFGKWHLGTLSRTLSSKGAKRQPERNYAPPWERDYDASLVTESAVCTWDPGLGPRAKNNPFYENGVALDGEDQSLRGGAARVVVDRAAPFIRQAAARGQPFLAVVWFHAPHEDIKAGPDYLKQYESHGPAAHYYGCVTEMDEQVGRLARVLDETGTRDNTILFFCSDNGPEGRKPNGRRAGTTAGLRGRKRSLHDGGVRVPAFAVWPGVVQANTRSDAILTTLDYFPTIQRIVDYTMPDDRPIDGEDIRSILTGKTDKRTKAIAFRYAGGTSALVKDGYKLLLPKEELYDLSQDRGEQRNLASSMPQQAKQMRQELIAFFESAQQSHAGGDYNDPTFKPVGPWRELKLGPELGPSR